MANFDNWIEQVKEQCVDFNFEYLSDWYSFRQAWADGMKPSEAIKDAVEWMDS